MKFRKKMLAFVLAVNVISPCLTTVHAAKDNIIDRNKPIVTIREDLGDGIEATPNEEVDTVPVEKQLWDGLSDEEKAKKILVGGGVPILEVIKRQL